MFLFEVALPDGYCYDIVVKNMKLKIVHVTLAIALIVACGCTQTVLRNGVNVISDFNPIFFPVVEQPRQESKTPFLGVHMEIVPDQFLSEMVKKDKAVYIDRIIPESAAEEAGIKSGDIVIAVDGESFDDKTAPRDQLKKAITGKNAGENLRLSIVRDGKEMIIEARLGVKKKTVPKIKPHPETDTTQKSMDKTSSAVYHTVEASGRLEDYLKTVAQLKEQSFFLDSYKIAPDNPFRLSEVNYLLQNPNNIIPVSREIADSILAHLKDMTYDMSGLVEEASFQLDVEFHPDTEEPSAMSSLDEVVTYITETISRAELYRKESFKGLSGEDKKFLEDEAPRLLSGDKETPELQEKLLKIAIKVDYLMLFRSIAEASSAVSPHVIEALKKSELRDIQRHNEVPSDVAEDDVMDVIDSRFGRIIIGGPGKTSYKGNAFLIIDFGGDDLYENNAGASTLEYPFSIVIDLAGNDRYITREYISQGSGFMGTGILADIQGNDLYMAEKGSQGAGIFGGGILLDLHGDDIFMADSDAQGAGMFGMGILFDMQGNDIYKAHRESQGFAFVKGFGALVDLEGGDFYLAGGKYPDHREPGYSTLSLSQGFATGIRPFESEAGASGGIGLLIDKDGNDKYIGDYFSQGASYWYSLGILHDMNGDDTYIAGRYAQGAGIHTSAGTLIDERGNDSYTVTFGVSQGVGHDYGIGVLADFGGDNTYKGGVLSKGAATCGSIGILYDKYGKNSYLTDSGVQESGSQDDDSCADLGFGILMNGRTD